MSCVSERRRSWQLRSDGRRTVNDQTPNDQMSGAQKVNDPKGDIPKVGAEKGSDPKGAGKADAGQTGFGRAARGIADFIARDRRPVTQIGSDMDYMRVTRSVRNLIAGVVTLVVLLVGLSLFVPVQEVSRARG